MDLISVIQGRVNMQISDWLSDYVLPVSLIATGLQVEISTLFPTG